MGNEKIIISTIFGAALGASASLLHSFISNKNKQVNNLGKEWPFLQADNELVVLFSELRRYRDLNEVCAEHYYKLGDDVEGILNLWDLVSSSDAARRRNNWGIKAFRFRDRIITRFYSLELDVPQGKEDKERKRELGTAPILEAGEMTSKKYFLEEYKELRDKVCENVENIYHNIRLELQL